MSSLAAVLVAVLAVPGVQHVLDAIALWIEARARRVEKEHQRTALPGEDDMEREVHSA